MEEEKLYIQEDRVVESKEMGALVLIFQLKNIEGTMRASEEYVLMVED